MRKPSKHSQFTYISTNYQEMGSVLEVLGHREVKRAEYLSSLFVEETDGVVTFEFWDDGETLLWSLVIKVDDLFKLVETEFKDLEKNLPKGRKNMCNTPIDKVWPKIKDTMEDGMEYIEIFSRAYGFHHIFEEFKIALAEVEMEIA